MKTRHILATLALFACQPVWAAEGRIELNQTCAESLGCLSGDSAGFPITIGKSGSYVLSSNLTTTSTSVNVIEVTADNVDIDLNGFSIIGPATCSGNAPSCNGTGSGASDGIKHSASGLQIHDGTITGMARFGIAAANNALIDRVIVRGNGSSGISATFAIVTNSVIKENGDYGFIGQGKMDNCIVMDNGNYGAAGLLSYINISNNYFISNAGSNATNPNTSTTFQSDYNLCASSAAATPSFCP